MTDEIVWGAEIKSPGRMPDFVDNDDRISFETRPGLICGEWRGGGERAGGGWCWETIQTFRLRADHPYYTRSDDTAVTITPMTVEEATAALYNIPTLRALGLIREETALERFEKAYGFMTTRERDTVGAFIEWMASFNA